MLVGQLTRGDDERQKGEPWSSGASRRDWLGDGPRRGRPALSGITGVLPIMRSASSARSKLKDLTARQVQKALAELSASLSPRSLRPPLLSTRLIRSLAHGEQLH
jgi:hypothetical protein